MIQRAPINSKKFEFLAKEYQLADTLPNELEMSNVELLILPERKKVIPGLHLLGSHLGWILSGRVPTEKKKAAEVSMFLMTGNSSQQYQQSFVAPLENVNPNVDDFWKLETIGIKEPINDCDDDLAIQNSHDTVRKTNRR